MAEMAKKVLFYSNSFGLFYFSSAFHTETLKLIDVLIFCKLYENKLTV